MLGDSTFEGKTSPFLPPYACKRISLGVSLQQSKNKVGLILMIIHKGIYIYIPVELSIRKLDDKHSGSLPGEFCLHTLQEQRLLGSFGSYAFECLDCSSVKKGLCEQLSSRTGPQGRVH